MITHVVAKTLVFNDEGKLLLLTRSLNDEHRPGGLDLPGGKVEDDEEVLAGAAREADEEAGLKLAPHDLYWIYADTVATYNTDVKGDVSMIRITYAAALNGQEVKLSHEHSDFAWYGLDEALGLLKGTRYETILNHMMQNDIASNLWKGKDNE